MLFKKLKREIDHFLSLPKEVQKLLKSYLLADMAYPIILIFVNAYIFRSGGDLITLSVYYLGHFISLFLGFFLNKFFIRRYRIDILYGLGTVLMGITPLLLVFFSWKSIFAYFLYGFISGIGMGFHWVNRNYLSVVKTEDENRNFFYAFSTSVNSILYLIVSFVSGWLIVFGLDYKWIMISAFVFLFLSGISILGIEAKKESSNTAGIANISKLWNKIRYLQFAIGFAEGMGYFYTTLMIMTYLGNEGILGSLNALTSVLSSILIYTWGRKSKSSDRRTVLLVTSIVDVALSLVLSFWFGRVAIILFVVTYGALNSFYWLGFDGIIAKAIDEEYAKRGVSRSACILNGEFFLDIGRSVSVLLGLGLFISYGLEFVLRNVSVILYGSLLIMVVYFLYIKKYEY